MKRQLFLNASYRQLECLTKIHRDMWMRYHCGRHKMNLSTAERVAKNLCMTREELLALLEERYRAFREKEKARAELDQIIERLKKPMSA